MKSEDDQDESFNETGIKKRISSRPSTAPEKAEKDMKMEEAEKDTKMGESAEKDAKKKVQFGKDGDHILTPSETKAFRAVFDLCDVNCDGLLSVAELESQVIRLVLQAKEGTVEDQTSFIGGVEDEEDESRPELRDIPAFEISHVVHELDEHKAGSFNWPEFCHVVKHKFKDVLEDHNLKNCLKVLDLRGTGYVNSLDLREFVTTRGSKPLTKAEADEFLHVADPEGEGVVDCDDLIKWIVSNQPQPQKSGTDKNAA